MCWLFVTPWNAAHQVPLSVTFSRPEYSSGCPFPSPGDLPNPGIEPRFPALPVNSLPAEPEEKPKNTGVDSLSRLQRIFPTQESNLGFLHCRQILYPLSYQVSPRVLQTKLNLDTFIGVCYFLILEIYSKLEKTFTWKKSCIKHTYTFLLFSSVKVKTLFKNKSQNIITFHIKL